MDESGVDVQVLSLTTPGVQNLDPAEAIPLARDVNDLTAATVQQHPDRFEGFATLPTTAPAAAARELGRSVSELGLCGAMLCGRTDGVMLDDVALRPVFETAAALHVPLYIHPQIPERAVRQAYYAGFGHDIDLGLATGAPGWHYETGIQVLRLVLAGTFDRHPDLQIIVGHWGEVILFYLERLDLLSRFSLNLERPLLDYFRQNVSYTPSGIFSQRYLRWAMEVVGVERLMFSTDYPFQYAKDCGARQFLMHADLSDSERTLIACGNWERMRSATRELVDQNQT
jgi:predicted TIM-barrel fold metal-dependent hydrolase